MSGPWVPVTFAIVAASSLTCGSDSLFGPFSLSATGRSVLLSAKLLEFGTARSWKGLTLLIRDRIGSARGAEKSCTRGGMMVAVVEQPLSLALNV